MRHKDLTIQTTSSLIVFSMLLNSLRKLSNKAKSEITEWPATLALEWSHQKVRSIWTCKRCISLLERLAGLLVIILDMFKSQLTSWCLKLFVSLGSSSKTKRELKGRRSSSQLAMILNWTWFQASHFVKAWLPIFNSQDTPLVASTITQQDTCSCWEVFHQKLWSRPLLAWSKTTMSTPTSK